MTRPKFKLGDVVLGGIGNDIQVTIVEGMYMHASKSYSWLEHPPVVDKDQWFYKLNHSSYWVSEDNIKSLP